MNVEHIEYQNLPRRWRRVGKSVDRLKFSTDEVQLGCSIASEKHLESIAESLGSIALSLKHISKPQRDAADEEIAKLQREERREADRFWYRVEGFARIVLRIDFHKVIAPSGNESASEEIRQAIQRSAMETARTACGRNPFGGRHSYVVDLREMLTRPAEYWNDRGNLLSLRGIGPAKADAFLK